MPEVLHITAHMGGGAGRVLSGMAVYAENKCIEYRHRILMLEQPQKANFIELCKKNGIDVLFSEDKHFIEEQMRSADIIQIEWWHHPKMAEFLHCFPQIPVRLIIWCHISGCNYPHLPFELVKVPHSFVFTSKYSLENPYWTQQQRDYAVEHAQVINSSGGFGHVPGKLKAWHEGFNIGYSGTLNYSKLHPDFAAYASTVDVPDARFILVGDIDNHAAIERDARLMGVIDKIQFTGYTRNIYKELARFDVFSYILNPEHFGTTENALLEAMAAGLPAVALNQCAEKYLIQHMETGLLADSMCEYAEYIRYLHENPCERKRIGENASRFVRDIYSIENTVKKMNKVYDAVMDMQEKPFEFDAVFGRKPYEWFLACLGEDKKFFEESIDSGVMSHRHKAAQIEQRIFYCRHILREKSKSSIAHFARCFPGDSNIMYWKSIIDKHEVQDNVSNK